MTKGYGSQASSSAEGGSQIVAQGSKQTELAEEALGRRAGSGCGPCEPEGDVGRMAVRSWY